MIVEWDIEEEAPLIDGSTPLVVDGAQDGSEEWLALRAGNITGSKVAHMMAKGDGLTRDKYRVQLAIERMTGKPTQQTFKSKAMIRGNEDEPLAREYYEFLNDVDVRQVMFVWHPHLDHAGASPDGLVGDDGLLEIKCPNMETHIGYLLAKKVPGKYLIQMQWQMACTGRAWCDFMSYCKELPIHLRAWIIRVPRDEAKIAELERMAAQFNTEIEALIKKLGELS